MLADDSRVQVPRRAAGYWWRLYAQNGWWNQPEIMPGNIRQVRTSAAASSLPVRQPESALLRADVGSAH
jgi:hypothetical protein